MPTNLTELQVREVAARQKAVIYCILYCVLGYLVLVAAAIGLPQTFKPAAGLGFLALIVVAVVCFYRLASRFHRPVMAVLMTIATVIPLIGLIVLLSINGKATDLLKRNGVKVGFLGATV